MTIAHFSDTHLGFRAYGRTTPGGLNQREADVMATFQAALDAILERDPDLVIHAGDLFHVVRPGNATLVRAFQTFAAFQSRRKGKPLVLIGGNHDTPRSSDAGNILRLFESIPGCYLVPQRAETLDFPELDLEVFAVPSFALGEQFGGLRKSKLESRTPLGRKHSVLTLHGMARQALPRHAQFDLAETDHDEWTYVALGDYHVFQPYGRNVCYSGATDFTSSNIWEEASAPKGWVWFDTEFGQLQFNLLQTRAVLDLPLIDAESLDLEEIEARMILNGGWSEAMPIVRQRILNFPPGMRGKLNPEVVRALSTRALTYQLAISSPQLNSAFEQSEIRTFTLEQRWTEHIADSTLTKGVSKDALRDLGLELLKEVG